MEITDNNDRDGDNFFGGDYNAFLENPNSNISISLKKDEKKDLNRICSFENLKEEEKYSKTELNKMKINFKVQKKKEKEKEDVTTISFMKKKTSRKLDENIKKKKNPIFKTKTEINDYQTIKEKNKKNLDEFTDYKDYGEEFIDVYGDEQDKGEGLSNMLGDFDVDVKVNQSKNAYECKTNVDNSERLNMFISSEINI